MEGADMAGDGVLKQAGIEGRTVNVHAHLMARDWLRPASAPPEPPPAEGAPPPRRTRLNPESQATGFARATYDANDATRENLDSLLTDDERARMRELDVRRRGANTLLAHAEVYVDEMDEAGIDTMVPNLMDHADFPESQSVMRYVVPWEQVLEDSAAVRERFPGRFEITAGVNPRRKDAPKVLERAVRDYGALALGEMTATMFRTMPTEKELCYPLYEKACELGVPMMHDATMPLGYSDPHIFERLATDFPTLQICLGGCGAGVNDVATDDGEIPAPERMLQLACEYENIWLDLDDWQRRDEAGKTYYVDFVHRAMASDARGKAMFGSDYPVYNWMYTEGGWVRAILEHAVEIGRPFTPDELAAFFSSNALRFLGLSSATT